MTISELAKDFTDLLKRGDDEAPPRNTTPTTSSATKPRKGPMSVCRGKDAVKQKGDWWRENHEVHSASVEGPYVNGDQFAVRFKYDITPKETGKRVTMDEVGLYTVKGGKITEERFFY